MNRPVTLQDVATAAGVSMQTVSRVVNRKPDVADDTRVRVWKIIHELGYRPNKLARSLVSQRSHILGIISLPLNDPFRAEVITATEREARARGYACLLGFVDDSMVTLPHIIEQMLERQVDGLLLITGKILEPSLVPFAVPGVSLAYPIDDAQVINVDIDNLDGSYQAMRHLTSLGHRAIGVVAGPLQWKAAEDRLEGARRALAEIGQTLDGSWIYRAESWTIEAGYQGSRKLLAQHPQLTALFCHNDWMAIGAYRALAEQNLRVPEDVSVVGYDDVSVSPYVTPPLTSVRQPIAGLGELLVQLLVNAIEYGNNAPSTMLVKTELQIRSSTAVVA